MKVPSAGGSTKHIAEGKGVLREKESEGSSRQTAGLMKKNCVRHLQVGKSAKQDEAQSYTEPVVQTQQTNGRKDCGLTRGDLTDARL